MTAPYAQPRVFVISLPRSAERRRDMADRLSRLGLEFSFIDGVDGAALDAASLQGYDRRRRRLVYGRDLTPGELGCLLSHRAVYRKIAEQNIPHALVLEDDARMTADFPAVLERLMARAGEWDAVRFLAWEKSYRKSRFIGKLMEGYDLTRPHGTPGGAYATLLNTKAARAMAARLDPFWMPGDVALGHLWKDGVDVYAVRPSPVSPDMVIESTIGDRRFSKAPDVAGAEWLLHRCMRGAFKLRESIDRVAMRLVTASRDAGKKTA